MAASRTTHVRPARRARVLPLVACAVLVLAGLANALRAPHPASALALGRGNYAVTASVFGTEADGLIGEVMSSGRKIPAFGRMVALPACTESSCPWLQVGADPGGKWGSQTACAESDGLCWVQVTEPETGACAVAPVYDLGPLFQKDDWWDLRRDRTYFLKRGLPAAEAARDGADLGFGPGMSDAGYDIAGEYSYAAAIDIGAGTWVDLGLDPAAGVSDLRVKLLWQAGVNHEDACSGAYGNGETSEDVRLRSGPSTDTEILANLDPAQRLSISGPLDGGFYQVDVDGRRGFVSAKYLAPDGGDVGDVVGLTNDSVNFRAGPSTADDVLATVPEGTAVVVTGGPSGDFLPVRLRGEDGWIASSYLDLGDADAPSDGGGGSGSPAVTTDDVNFRASPSLSVEVLRVLPAGTSVTLTGDRENGFVAARVDGRDGWIYAGFVMVADDPGQTATVTEDLNLRAGPSTADRVLLVMPAGAVVTLTGARQNGFLAVRYDGQEGWAFAGYLSS